MRGKMEITLPFQSPPLPPKQFVKKKTFALVLQSGRYTKFTLAYLSVYLEREAPMPRISITMPEFKGNVH